MQEDKKSFYSLVATQFLGSFNDNLFKQLVLFLAAGILFKGEDKQGVAVVIFTLPFVLFSGMAGDLSERFSKRQIIVYMKVAEIGIMGLGAYSLQLMNWPFMLFVLFLMGLQSAFFGPSKYGVIPELVPSTGLLAANGVIAMTTFIGILLGQALAGPLIDTFSQHLWKPGTVCAGLAILGTVTALNMGPLKAQKPDLTLRMNPFGSLGNTIRILRKQDGLFRFVILYSLFWFNGVVIQQAILGLGEPDYLNIMTGEKRLLSFILVTLALSIIFGSIIGPRLTKFVSAGYLAVGGATAMVAGQLALLLVGKVFDRSHGGIILTHFLMSWIGMAGAFFVVPIQSYLQHAPQKGMKGQTFALNNFMNFLFMLVGGATYLVARLPNTDLGPTLTQAIAGVILLSYLLVNWRRIARLNIA